MWIVGLLVRPGYADDVIEKETSHPRFWKSSSTVALLVPAPQAQTNRSFLRRFFSKKRLPSCFKLNLSGSN
jgi:hypothetical protein